jgi:hypothetical protein
MGIFICCPGFPGIERGWGSGRAGLGLSENVLVFRDKAVTPRSGEHFSPWRTKEYFPAGSHDLVIPQDCGNKSRPRGFVEERCGA